MLYFEKVTEGWVVAHGGRCYRAEDAYRAIASQYQCKVGSCTRWCANKEAYIQHWHDKHNFVAYD